MELVKGGNLVSLPEEADSLFKVYNRTASAAPWAIRFAASLKNVMVVSSGMSAFNQAEQLKEVAKVFENSENR
ncbi:MAG: hypothetical protein LBK73_15865 [Treponema sp.]|nr:hypothetical protein [Treponema sp.]